MPSRRPARSTLWWWDAWLSVGSLILFGIVMLRLAREPELHALDTFAVILGCLGVSARLYCAQIDRARR